MTMIGIDFDNTIVCYDDVFFRAARERDLITADTPMLKRQIRDQLRAAGREDEWTELQTFVYGQYIVEADPFPGVIEFLEKCTRSDVSVRIVSHKTEKPYRGPAFDLRAAALIWLEDRGFFETSRTGLSSDTVFFESTREDKMARIGRLGCSTFIDDLPEFLCDPNFPSSVRRVWFDPSGQDHTDKNLVRCRSWDEIARAALVGTADE